MSLRLQERRALLILMTLVEECSNAQIDEKYHLKIDRAVRENLVDAGLIKARKTTRPRIAWWHELTEEGWRRCRDEFTRPAPERSDPTTRVLYGVLPFVDALLRRNGQQLADLLTVPAATPPDLPTRLREAYEELTENQSGLVSLIDIREALSDTPRPELDELLRTMNRSREIVLSPDADQKNVTPASRAAAIEIGGEAKHELTIPRS
jgi:hypothetical protein